MWKSFNAPNKLIAVQFNTIQQPILVIIMMMMMIMMIMMMMMMMMMIYFTLVLKTLTTKLSVTND